MSTERTTVEGNIDRMKQSVEESKRELAHTIATMTLGILRTHMICLPAISHTILKNRAIEFLTETHGVDQQIEGQLVKSMTRPPAA